MKDKEFRFNRYINGKLMAEGITTVASNYDEAVNKATRAYGKDTVVLILNNTIDPRDEAALAKYDEILGTVAEDATVAPEPVSTTHKWSNRMSRGNLEFCEVCGIVRRADDKNKPCRGPVAISLRTAMDQDQPSVEQRRMPKEQLDRIRQEIAKVAAINRPLTPEERETFDRAVAELPETNEAPDPRRTDAPDPRDEVLRILREATGRRDFHSEMEAAEWAAKILAEAQTQEKIAQRLADLSAGRELEAVQRAAELEAQLADARLDSARLDCVLKFMNDQSQFWLFLYLHKTKLQTTRGDADLDEWRKWIDAAIDAAIKEAQ